MAEIYVQKCNRQICLDTETTGKADDGTPGDHRIIEIGCVELIDRKLTGNNLQIYLNPNRKVDEEAFRVHGLSNEYLEQFNTFHDEFEKFYKYINGAELIIHNAKFDVGFINHEFALDNRNLKLENICQITDSIDIAKKKYPGQKVSLDALCSKLNVDASARTAHGALLDSELLAEVFLALTGGQEEFLFDMMDEDKENDTSVLNIERKDVVGEGNFAVILPSAAEKVENCIYLMGLSNEKGLEHIGFGDEYKIKPFEGEKKVSEATILTNLRMYFVTEDEYSEYLDYVEDLLFYELENMIK